MHHPWLFPPDDARAYAEYAGRLTEDATKAGFLVCERAVGDDGTGAAAGIDTIVGVININNIVRGSFLSGSLGYYVASSHAGNGYMTEGLGIVKELAFDGLGLHRLEANIQPTNLPSINLVRRCGFRREGLSPHYLFIDGEWRDHERWAITAEMVR